ncbi:MAG: hypothetical protein H6569_12020 [Lewinellaceae bacterium]|nr:hypothetical protein [Lewinellaceae bacterium]
MTLRTKPGWLMALIVLIYTSSFLLLERWPTQAFGGDPWGYYAHLPSILLFEDVGNYQKTIDATAKYEPNMVDPRIDKYGVRETPIGKFCIKYPLGVAMLEVPFFTLGHAWAVWSAGAYDPDGFSRPYLLLAGLGGVFYAVLGLWLLWFILTRYFSKTTSAAMLLTIALGTNLFYFSVYNNIMSHVFLFFLHAALLLASIRFWEQPGGFRAMQIGAIAGLIAITRTQELIVAAIPVLWGVTNRSALIERWRFLIRHWQLAGLAVLAFVLVLLPQLFYWKVVSGSWIYFSYQGETFDFKHPHIWGGLTSFTNGWLIYTPVMLFALLGLFRLPKTVPDAVWPTLIFLSLHLYITYSWWCWYYINGFGSRPMVETYALLALPLGAFWQWGTRYFWKKWANRIVITGFIILNLFQTWQLHKGILWTQETNRAYYFAIFGTIHPDRNALIAYESGESQPRKGLTFQKKLAVTRFEDSTSIYRTDQVAFSGKWAHKPEAEFSGGLEIHADTAKIKPGDWLRISIQGFVPDTAKIWNRDHMALLCVEMSNSAGKTLKYRFLRISNKIGNKQNSIWDTGDTGYWGEAAFFVKTPRQFPADGTIKVYIWNPRAQQLIVDDLSVEFWR